MPGAFTIVSDTKPITIRDITRTDVIKSQLFTEDDSSAGVYYTFLYIPDPCQLARFLPRERRECNPGNWNGKERTSDLIETTTNFIDGKWTSFSRRTPRNVAHLVVLPPRTFRQIPRSYLFVFRRRPPNAPLRFTAQRDSSFPIPRPSTRVFVAH